MNLKSRVFTLLKSWCDKMLETSINFTDIPYLKGGILCPACGYIHGRIGDLCLPLMLCYKVTGEEKYFSVAKDVIDWSEYNIICADGTYRNDVNTAWKGITAFSAMAIGDCLINFKDVTDKETYDKWEKSFIVCPMQL